MMTVEFITALFSEVDEQLRAIPKPPEAHLWPSEVVTLGLLHGFCCNLHLRRFEVSSSSLSNRAS
jgi:hypothetical protein